MMKAADYRLSFTQDFLGFELFNCKGPFNHFHSSIFVFNQGGAAFNPVNAIEIRQFASIAAFSLVNVTTYDPVEIIPASRTYQGILKTTNERTCRLHFELDLL